MYSLLEHVVMHLLLQHMSTPLYALATTNTPLANLCGVSGGHFRWSKSIIPTEDYLIVMFGPSKGPPNLYVYIQIVLSRVRKEGKTTSLELSSSFLLDLTLVDLSSLVD